MGIRRAVASWLIGDAVRRPPARQPLEGSVGVGSCEPGCAGDGITGGRTETE